MKSWLKIYLAGALLVMATSGILQDLHGKEWCLRSMDASWSPWYISTPLNIVLLIGSMVLLSQGIKTYDVIDSIADSFLKREAKRRSVEEADEKIGGTDD